MIPNQCFLIYYRTLLEMCSATVLMDTPWMPIPTVLISMNVTLGIIFAHSVLLTASMRHLGKSYPDLLSLRLLEPVGAKGFLRGAHCRSWCSA